MSELTDEQLGAALVSGDETALESLYDRYGSLAYSVAYRVLGDQAKCEDVVQDVFVRLWSSGSFDPARGKLRTWLITAVRNRSIDYLRGRGRHERNEREIPEYVASEGQGSDPWREVALSLQRDSVREAINTLPPEQRQTIELAYFGGYSHREISEMIRVPLSTVKGRMRLALEKVHSYLLGRGFVYD